MHLCFGWCKEEFYFLKNRLQDYTSRYRHFCMSAYLKSVPNILLIFKNKASFINKNYVFLWDTILYFKFGNIIELWNIYNKTLRCKLGGKYNRNLLEHLDL